MFALSLLGCTSEMSDVGQKEVNINEVSDKLSELQKQIEGLKTENETLKKEQGEAETMSSITIKEGLKKTLKCGNGYALSLNKSYCVKIPYNAHVINSLVDVWQCNEGYYEEGNFCVLNQVVQNTIPSVQTNLDALSLDRERLEIERQRFELAKEKLALETVETKSLSFERGTGKNSASVHGVTVTYRTSEIDSEKTSGFTHEEGSSFWKYTFDISFDNVGKFLTIPAGGTILGIQEFSSTATTFTGLSHKTSFSGMGGHNATAIIYLEKPDSVGTMYATFTFFVLDEDKTVGNIVLTPFR